MSDEAEAPKVRAVTVQWANVWCNGRKYLKGEKITDLSAEDRDALKKAGAAK